MSTPRFSRICAFLILGAAAAPDASGNHAFLGKNGKGGGNSTLEAGNATSTPWPLSNITLSARNSMTSPRALPPSSSGGYDRRRRCLGQLLNRTLSVGNTTTSGHDHRRRCQPWSLPDRTPSSALPPNSSEAHDRDRPLLSVRNATTLPWSQFPNTSQGYNRDGPLCYVHEILDRGEGAAYWLYNKHHQKYLSTDRNNVDLYHEHGSHAVWHFTRASQTTTNTFYMVNDWAQKYMDAHDHNVWLWRSHRGLWDTGSVPENLKWHLFEADHITRGAEPCTFYLLHEGSNEWLDAHNDNVQVSPYLVDNVSDLYWQLIPAQSGRR